MKLKLYPCFQHWLNYQTIYVISDTHFNDPGANNYRKNYPGDDEQISKINKILGKKDLLIILGDVGDIEYIRKIRCAKCLICGNHDAGASNYQREIKTYKLDKDTFTKDQAREHAKLAYPGWQVTISEGYDFHNPFEYWLVTVDNRLFDEVYEGPVFINEKVLLSHEPIELPFVYNLHGHKHCGYQAAAGFNCVTEFNDYTPINLKKLLESGVLKNISSIHRVTIDTATERSRKKKNKVI